MGKDKKGDFKCTRKSNFEFPPIQTVSYGLESIRYLSPKIWKLALEKLKEIPSLKIFKKKVKYLEFKNCP